MFLKQKNNLSILPITTFSVGVFVKIGMGSIGEKQGENVKKEITALEALHGVSDCFMKAS